MNTTKRPIPEFPKPLRVQRRKLFPAVPGLAAGGPIMTGLAKSPAFLALLLACGLFSAGCHLGQPASASFASVTISGRTAKQICDTAVAVFRADGYEAFTSGEELIFEKEGTQANNIAQNGLVGTHYGARTIIRVKTEIVDLGGGSLRLQGQAFVVRNAGDSFFENEHHLANIRSRPYQKLMDEVASRLKQP
jgi:hypothetical protein